MNEKDDKITHLGILSNLENGRILARFSNSPGTAMPALSLFVLRIQGWRRIVLRERASAQSGGPTDARKCR